jgi:hypothetical protein
MSDLDDFRLPDDVDAGAAGEGGTATEQGEAGPGRGEEVLDTGPAEAGSPSAGEGLTDDELVEQLQRDERS